MENGAGGSSRWGTWVAGSVVAAVAIAAVLAFVSEPEKVLPPAAPPKPEVVRGSACPSLLEAADALQQRDYVTFVEAIRSARAAALQSLNEGGVIFGKPEEMAVKLSADPLEVPLSNKEHDEVESVLATAQESCGDLSS